MPMDGMMLGYLKQELLKRLLGGRIDKIMQPERDEINMLVRNGGENHLLLISASANHARIHITRAKKPSPLEPPMFLMLLRKHLSGGRISGMRQIGGDRILMMDVDTLDETGEPTHTTLAIELMGRHSNIILMNKEMRIYDSIRHITPDISRVRLVLPGLMYELPPAQDKLAPQSLSKDAVQERLVAGQSLSKALGGIVSGIAPPTAREIAYRIWGEEEGRIPEDPAPLAGKIAGFFENLPKADPHLLMDEEDSPLDVLPFPFLGRAHLPSLPQPGLSEAFDLFFEERDRHERIRQKSASLLKILKNNIERCEKKLALQTEALEDSARMEEYRIKGELLTAGAHLVPRGKAAAELPNYYDPDMKPLLIELREDLSPAANAQRYFKRYQKAKSAHDLAFVQREKTLEELSYLESQLDNLFKCEFESELNEIREELTKEGYVRASHNRRQIKKLPPSKPHLYLAQDGTQIFVGKNNLQNDKLTMGAAGNEIWLHAKDMPGSHVIIKSSSPSQDTLNQAAMLAAYFSKGKNSSRVPVDYTQRKYVKKPGGAKPGYVIYTNQRTLYITPEESAVLKMRAEE